MRFHYSLVAGALCGLTILTVGQIPPIKPKAGPQRPLPPIPGRPGLPGLPNVQPKLPLPDPKRPLIDPFKSRNIVFKDKLAQTKILTPGDQVEFDPPKDFDMGKARIMLEDRADRELYELPVERFGRVTKVPSKFTYRNTRLPATYSRYGFTAPQVPRGSYDVYYQQDLKLGPRQAIEIRPQLVASGRRTGSVDGRAFVMVRPVGPVVSPRQLRTALTLKLPNGQTSTSLSNVNLEPAAVRPTIALADMSGPITYPGIDRIRADESGQARFEFGLRQVGTGQMRFQSEGFDPANYTITVRARRVVPEVEAPNRNLRLVTIGDSLAWGQGLKESSKFSFKTAQRMQQLSGRNVSRIVFAHSGGTILEGSGNGDRRFPGEVPAWHPSIPRQAEMAADSINNGTVDLVLVDGGINDVDVMKIINPFLDTRSEVRQSARAMKGAIRDMLVDIGRSFSYRKSLIVYTGNYPIITSQSQIELMASAFALAVALAPIPGAAGIASTVAGTVIAGILIARKDEIVSQSQIFYSEITDAIQEAIGEANDQLGTNGEDRILFADPGYTSAQGFAAPGTRLWTFGIEDEVADTRAVEGAPFALESPQYVIAAMGHPNVQGAQKYADRISALISTASSRTIWDATRPRKRMNVTMNRTINVPAGTTGVEVEFRITARDASTGENTPGNVFINGEFVGRTGDLLRRMFRRPSASDPKPTILVARPGFADGILDYQITG